jgi:hypothetical protein
VDDLVIMEEEKALEYLDGESTDKINVDSLEKNE